MCSRRPLLLLALLFAVVGAPGAARGKVYLSQQEALALAFPEADRVVRRNLVLTPEQVDAIEKRARSALESRIVTVHTGIRDGRVLGHAFIDVHQVRTLPEAFMVVVSPEGRVQSLRILAFYEPPEYEPPGRWLRQFEDERLDEGLRLRGRIHGIAGSTLSSRAVTGSVRRALALFEMVVQQEAVADEAAAIVSPGR